MKLTRLFAAGLALACFALTCPTAAQAEAGFYVGGALGQGYIDETIDGNRIDADSTAYRVFGGYSFSDFFGVEVSYLDIGTFRETIEVAGQDVPVSASADGFALAAVGTLPLAERFSVHGRAGFWFHDSRTTVDGLAEAEQSEESPFVGLGLGFALTETVELNAGIDYIDTDDADPLLATVGFTLRF